MRRPAGNARRVAHHQGHVGDRLVDRERVIPVGRVLFQHVAVIRRDDHHRGVEFAPRAQVLDDLADEGVDVIRLAIDQAVDDLLFVRVEHEGATRIGKAAPVHGIRHVLGDVRRPAAPIRF